MNFNSGTTRIPRQRRSLSFARTLERAVVEHPRALRGLRMTMIGAYALLIGVPPMLPNPPKDSPPWAHFTSVAQFAIWGVWWPFVVLSMVLLGRVWCGLFCPEGALVSMVAPLGGSRPIPRWMQWRGIPLLAFVGITIIAQVLEVDETPSGQLVVLGGSTLLAVMVAYFYSKRTWGWCRYLCPVSLLFGVFSRLGALHFAVDKKKFGTRITRPMATSRGPCPVGIHLPTMNSNRDCLMCFRCAGYQDAIYLALRKPGNELERIHAADPLTYEVLFLFGGAIGLPLGVFWCERMNYTGWVLVSVLLMATAISIVLLSTVVGMAAALVRRCSVHVVTRADLFRTYGYVFTPVSLFSLFIGLSQPTFDYLSKACLPPFVASTLRLVALLVGTLWSLALVRTIVDQGGPRTWATSTAATLLAFAVVAVTGAWARVIW